MTQNSGVKIRVLPRSTEPKRPEGARADSRPNHHRHRRARWPGVSKRHALGAALFALAAAGLGLALRPSNQTRDLASKPVVRDPVVSEINKLVEDVKLKRQIQRQRAQLQNIQSTPVAGEVDGSPSAPELSRSYGVQLDSENQADAIYQQLNDRPRAKLDLTPDDRINAMLEKNKWLNQQEREERVNYVRNFIKTAYDRGYEVDLDENLRVVNVRPIAQRRVTIDQVMEKVSRQGI